MNPKRSFLLITILLISVFVNAQTNYRPGYVIKSNNDTIYGIIDYRDDKIMSTVCKFKTNEQSEETTFSPEDIFGFRFIDSKYFISKEVDGEKVFLEYLIKGKINAYYQRDEKGDHYYMENDSSGIIELPYEEGIRYEEENPYLYQSTKHLGVIKAFMKDAPKTLREIEDVKTPGHRNLIKIAKDYHHEVCSNEECIIYEKKVPLMQISLEPAAGMIFFKYYEFWSGTYSSMLHKKNHFQTGLFAHVMLPRVNDNLSFRIGCLYSEMAITQKNIYYLVTDNGLYSDTISLDGNIRVFKIPVQLQYNYPKGIIRPMAAFGFNLYNPFFQSLSLTAGTDIKLSKSIYLNMCYDFEFFSEIFKLKYHLLSQSLLMGIKVKL
ncbi:MAG TPA: hypothetical protein PKH79_09225 [Prolixibacteraceae bacterium]|nr:hypothetical protein [Prolixibacteraceae bacterium]